MKGTYAALMQSKYFNPAFNSAIFDGPIRIYFAQAHEPLALKIYFHLQQNYAAEVARAKELAKNIERTVLLMLYPSTDSFQNSFESDAFLQVEQLHDDTVIGVNGPFEDQKLDQVLASTLEAIQSWEKIPYEKSEVNAIL
jgi:hypothetical protein